MRGRIIVDRIGSAALKDNPLGDPHARDLVVYLPPSYGAAAGERYPVLYYLPGFTGTARGVIGTNPWKENLTERLDRLIGSGEAEPCLLIIVDPFTLYGGSQYVNSQGTGRYEDYVVDEIVPYVDSKFATRAQRRHRAVFGKSSGGFGALWLASRHPDLFAHLWSHSGDLGWEASLAREFPVCVNQLAPFGGRFSRFLQTFRRLQARQRGELPHELVMTAALSACYSPNPRSRLGFDIPFDERTAERVPAVWRRWLAFDPLTWAPRRASALRSLDTFVFDCGRKDEFFLHLGSRILARELKRLGVAHRYEEHEFGHRDMGERYDRSLALLSSAAA